MNMESANRRKLEKLLDRHDRAIYLWYLGYDPVNRDRVGFTESNR